MDCYLDRTASRLIDTLAIEEYAMTGLVLMENAGRGCAEWLCRQVNGGRVVLFCGKGNNGGDGFVIARHLELRNRDVLIVLCCDPRELSGDALANYQIARAAQLPIVEFSDVQSDTLADEAAGSVWCVDALLGTGAQGAPRPPIRDAISLINQSAPRVLAIDIPSGLDCDTGMASEPVIRANHTCTFVAPKVGFQQPGADAYTGSVHVVEIGVPRELLVRTGVWDGQRGS